MTITDYIRWFEDLVQRGDQVPQTSTTDVYFEEKPALAWLTEAESALAAAFPPYHPCRARWGANLERARTNNSSIANLDTFHAAQGIIQAAFNLIKADRLQSVIDGIIAQSTSELLGQAELLLSQRYVVAAAVLAGGAIESHLLHLCQKHSISWSGDGSISKYNSVIGQARNQGIQIYSANDGKLVESWGGIRNEAAHTPTTFVRSSDEVRIMVEGVRQFISRVT